VSKIAIHPQTLDCREFKPGQDLFKLGYVVVKGVEDIPEQLSGQVIDNLVAKFSHKRVTKRSRLTILTMMWPDLVLYSLNNIAPVPGPVGAEQEAESAKPFPRRFSTFASKEVYDPRKPNANEMLEFTSHEVALKSPVYAVQQKVEHPGRGNHKPRLPMFRILPVEMIPRMCPQASILALELQKLRNTKEIMTLADVPGWLKTINLATVQAPMRIFRYYFWELVKMKIIEPVQYTTMEQIEQARDESYASQEK
jgi:hypothetical protein